MEYDVRAYDKNKKGFQRSGGLLRLKGQGLLDGKESTRGWLQDIPDLKCLVHQSAWLLDDVKTRS